MLYLCQIGKVCNLDSQQVLELTLKFHFFLLMPSYHSSEAYALGDFLEPTWPYDDKLPQIHFTSL